MDDHSNTKEVWLTALSWDIWETGSRVLSHPRLLYDCLFVGPLGSVCVIARLWWVRGRPRALRCALGLWARVLLPPLSSRHCTSPRWLSKGASSLRLPVHPAPSSGRPLCLPACLPVANWPPPAVGGGYRDRRFGGAAAPSPTHHEVRKVGVLHFRMLVGASQNQGKWILCNILPWWVWRVCRKWDVGRASWISAA